MGLPRELKYYTGLIDDPNINATLKTWHKQAVVLHLEGWKITEIAEQLHKSVSGVRQVLQRDDVKQLIESYYSFLDSEYRSLYQLAVQAMRDAMRETAPLELRVNTAKFFLQGKGKGMAPESAGGESAEDLVQRVINVYVDQRGNPDASSEINKRMIPQHANAAEPPEE
jgi:DNA-binding protein Fis